MSAKAKPEAVSEALDWLMAAGIRQAAVHPELLIGAIVQQPMLTVEDVPVHPDRRCD